jgi:hypothetical protein
VIRLSTSDGPHPRPAVVLAIALLGCGPGGAPEPAASTTEGAATTAAADSTGSASAGADTGPIDGTSSDTTGVVDECPLRALPHGSGMVWRVHRDGMWDYYGPSHAECVLDEVMIPPPVAGTTQLEMSCTLPDGSLVALSVSLRVELEVLPFEAGTWLAWERVAEHCCAGKADQHFLSLRDEAGELRLGLFDGFAPAGLEGAEDVIEPITLDMSIGLCPPEECEPFGGCTERGAVDLWVAGSGPVRLFDGTVGNVGVDPLFRAYVARAGRSFVGLGAPDLWASVVLTRLTP